jgi:c-di-GMP-binding flagellar brake protein YcgR
MLDSLRRFFSNGQPHSYVRRWQRIVMSEPARVLLQDGDTRPVMLTQLGAGGARISLPQRLRPGDLVQLDFNVGVAERRQMTALVVHSMKDERAFQWMCGLSFVEVEPKGDRRIAEFVEEEQRRRQIGFAMPRA